MDDELKEELIEFLNKLREEEFSHAMRSIKIDNFIKRLSVKPR